MTKMVKLRLNNADELNFGTTRYVVSNSPKNLDIGEVLVDEAHAAHFLSTSCGATRVEEPEPVELVRCQHCGCMRKE
jgi:hypothetical protein